MEDFWNRMSELFRFELSFDGEVQNVGFLQALDEVGLQEEVTDDLYSLFDTLPIPKLCEPTSFWFTSAGIKRYRGAIDRVIDEIAENNWQLVGAYLEDSADNAIYKDDLQVAFQAEYILSRGIKYVKVNDVDAFISSVKS